MNAPPGTKAFHTCQAFIRARASGEEESDIVGYLAEAEGIQRPAIWKRLRQGGALPPYNVRRERSGRLAAGIKGQSNEPKFNMAQVVDRDPCQRCGARGDYDCGHRRVRLGTQF
jgi:hypothetical protein